MHYWLFIALLPPIIDAAINFVDKFLVEGKLDYKVLPVTTTITAFVVGTTFWFLTGQPTMSVRDTLLVMTTGVLSIWGIVLYFKALSGEETSKVIALFKITPVITLILSLIFLKEVISLKQYIGFFLVLGGVFALSLKKDSKIFELSKAFWLILLYDFTIAFAVIVLKFTIDANSFTKIFPYESWGITLGGVVLYLCNPSMRKAFHKMIKTVEKKTIVIVFMNELLYVTSKAMFFLAFSLGPAVLVNVIGSTQIFFGIVFGWILTKIAPKIFQEEIGAEGLTKKIVAAVVIFGGIILVY